LSGISTETALREWRYGSTQAERLAAAILRLEKYQNIEPQAPLGGGDGGADILCDRGGRLWVGAVSFPPTNQDFKAIKKKFNDDLQGAKKRKRHGIVFVTNQRITRGERQALVETALKEKQECNIYDVERISGVLDSAEGYGVRVGYLRISMSPEEQIAYFASRENLLEGVITENTERIQVLATQIANLKEGQHHVAHTMQVIAKSQDIVVEPLRAFDPLAMGEITGDADQENTLADITPATILLAHRLVCFDLPTRLIGRFRQEEVFVQKATEAPDQPLFSPPDPVDVPALVAELCECWRDQYASLVTFDSQLEAIAEFFHDLICIHPFLDGNGRVARSLLMQQCIEFFGHVDMSLFGRGVDYYSALQAADCGELKQLQELVRRAVTD
jgi:fido (protein-threonine AMPylation protein)